jgi:hypothetical protein
VAASNSFVLGSFLCSFGIIIAVINYIQHLQIFGSFFTSKNVCCQCR